MRPPRCLLHILPCALAMVWPPAHAAPNEESSGSAAAARVTSVTRSRPTGSARARSQAPAASPQPTLMVDVNLPSYYLDAFVDGERVRRFIIAIGMPGYRTPRGDFEINAVEWNPWWIPPPRDWARNELAAPPGWSNPMGRMKLHFLPLYFIHGTPLEQSLGRAESHGCVRLSNADAIELALLVHREVTPAPESALLDSLVADTALTRYLPLAHPVPIRIRYDLAEVENDTLFLYRDVYRLDFRSELQRALDALFNAGVELTRVDEGELQKRLRSSPRRPARFAIRDLLLSGHQGATRIDFARPTSPEWQSGDDGTSSHRPSAGALSGRRR